MSINVLFVCLGNICRSPTAHAVFQQMVDANRLQHAIAVDSAGTGDWHIGKAPDKRSTAAGAKRGYDLSVLRARQVSPIDFQRYHYILAMDQQNLRDLQQMRPADYRGELALFLNYGESAEREVPDPYYGEGEGFEQVLDLVEVASAGLLNAIMLQYGLQPLRH
ncbi:MAG TPA: low molecular weight protein-tyrosine-phosphatase [Spongiibacteraceae bacterium]|nr:low molecular weight protein-tyrosine-phosphatase [Spongiibacteraceae bacterium]